MHLRGIKLILKLNIIFVYFKDPKSIAQVIYDSNFFDALETELVKFRVKYNFLLQIFFNS